MEPAVQAAGSFAFSVPLLAAASWEQLGSRREKDKIRKREKSPRGAVYYLALSFSYTKWDSLAQRFNLVKQSYLRQSERSLLWSPLCSIPGFPPNLPLLKIKVVSHLAVCLE